MGGYSWGRHCTGFLIFPKGEREDVFAKFEGCRARGSLAVAKRLLHGPCGADKLGISQHDWVTLRHGLVFWINGLRIMFEVFGFMSYFCSLICMYNDVLKRQYSLPQMNYWTIT